METFYDGDLKDIWDSDLDPTDSLKMSTDTDLHDWFLEKDVKDPAVILNDKLISEALLNGTLPIKTEHSYSLNSDGDSLPESPRSLQTKVDDMEDECYPAISLKTITSNLRHTDISTTSIDPKCLSISSSMAVNNFSIVTSPLVTSSNANTVSTAATSSISNRIILPLNTDLVNYNHENSAASNPSCTTITITKTNLNKQDQQHQKQLPQHLPNIHYKSDSCESIASSREGSISPDICSDIEIDESYIKDEPISCDSSCPSSPISPHGCNTSNTNTSISIGLSKSTIYKHAELHFEHKNGCLQLSPTSQSLLKSQQLVLSSSSNNQNINISKFSIKTEPANNNKILLAGGTKHNSASAYGLPLTPPSSLQSDDSEGNLSPEHLHAPLSPNTTVSASLATTVTGAPHTHTVSNLSSALRPPASSSSTSLITGLANVNNRNSNGGSTRQPIHTPLISSQPKGSTGTLILTEEEKRTLLAEGYPIPQKLPLTKAEEKSLKKIRRKIKNKISAQESRRKKKEYMDQLERRVEILVSENSAYRKRVDSLEDTNANLLSQLQKLQSLVQRQNQKRS